MTNTTTTEQAPHGPHAGPICPCGHPVAGHFLAGCLDTQWFDKTSDEFCPCARTELDERLRLLEGHERT